MRNQCNLVICDFEGKEVSAVGVIREVSRGLTNLTQFYSTSWIPLCHYTELTSPTYLFHLPQTVKQKADATHKIGTFFQQTVNSYFQSAYWPLEQQR